MSLEDIAPFEKAIDDIVGCSGSRAIRRGMPFSARGMRETVEQYAAECVALDLFPRKYHDDDCLCFHACIIRLIATDEARMLRKPVEVVFHEDMNILMKYIQQKN